jgi:hypothetical protein
MDFQHIIEAVGRFMDFAGVAVMVIGAVVSIPMALRGYQPGRLPAEAERMSVYRSYRQLLGRSILLGSPRGGRHHPHRSRHTDV